ncbi:hypothetical protein [Streptomyces sp. NPDC055085]
MPSMTALITPAEAASRPDRPAPSGGRPHPRTAHTIAASVIRRTTPVRSDADRSLGDLLLRMVRKQDALIPAKRRAPRTLAAMQARMADDACGLCGRWSCDPSTCPPSATAPTMGGYQCDTCGGWFGVTGAGTHSGVTAWTCSACQNIQA